jgi:hypothetical protein
MHWYQGELYRKWSDIGVGVRFLPLISFQLYLWTSVVLFAWGPWPWPVQDPVALYSYLCLAHFTLVLGYISGFTGKTSVSGSHKGDFKNLVTVSFLIGFALYFPTVYSRTGSFLPDVIHGLMNPGAAYASAVAISQSGGEFVYAEYARILFAPISALALPIMMINWQIWPRIYRVMAVVSIVCTVSLYLAMGTNKAIADLTVALPWLILLAIASRGLRISKIGWIKIGVICALLFLLWSVFFSLGQAQREGANAVTGVFGAPLQLYAERDQLYFSILPEPMALFYEAITRYITQGYYALSLALKLPFDSTLGIGHSMFLVTNVDAELGWNDLASRSYPARLEAYYGWGMYELWDSAYVWIASDVGFIGSLVIVFLVGRWLCLSWRDAITVRDPRAAVVFYFLVLAVFYLPANNQLMQNGETVVAFYFTLGWWLLRRNGVVLARKIPRA